MTFEIDLRRHIMPLVAGVVLIFVGLTAANIAGGIGQYTVGILNDSVGGRITINLFSNSLINILSTALLFSGIALIVAAVAFIIWALWKATGAVTEAPATA